MKPILLGLMGASGRLGQAIARLALQDPKFRLGAALTHPRSTQIGLDLGLLLGQKLLGLSLTAKPIEIPLDIFIDVSLPDGLSSRLQIACERKTPLIIGTTGFSEQEFTLIQEASTQIPLFYTSNFSLGMALLRKLAQETAHFFPADSDIDVIETHHTLKKDIPSGSALMLAQTVEEAHPLKKRPNIHSVRSGRIIGEHEIRFNTAEEQLILSHTSHTRDAFARGALSAAHFLVTQSPGLYGMGDLVA